MIDVFLGPRFLRSAKELSPEVRAKIETALALLAEQFGDPHRHGGLGLRKLGRAEWECRIDLRLRIILLKDADGLTAFDIMDHNEVRAWLKSRR